MAVGWLNSNRLDKQIGSYLCFTVKDGPRNIRHCRVDNWKMSHLHIGSKCPDSRLNCKNNCTKCYTQHFNFCCHGKVCLLLSEAKVIILNARICGQRQTMVWVVCEAWSHIIPLYLLNLFKLSPLTNTNCLFSHYIRLGTKCMPC